MNHDPRKAIRQAMMIARREVTAPNKASIGGQRHMLAYITPYEAELLMRRGGSGRLTEYGVPAFDDGDGAGGGGDAANSEASTQDAGGGNAGEGAGPTGAGAGATGETGPDDTDASVSGNPAAVSTPTAPTATAPFGTQGFGQAPSALGMGMIGTIGGLATGVPGLGAIGTAIGTGMDVEGLNAQLGMMGLEQNIAYDQALAHNMSLGMFGKSATDQFGQTLGFDALAEAPMSAFSAPQGLPDAPADTSGADPYYAGVKAPKQPGMQADEEAQRDLLAARNPMQQPLMYAGGGAVGYADGGMLGDDPMVQQALRLSSRVTDKRTPQLQDAADLVAAGRMAPEEYHALVGQYKPVQPYTNVPPMASEADLFRGLSEDKHGKVGAEKNIPEGHPVGLRLDIPAYDRHGVWAPTIHDGHGDKAKAIAHAPFAHVSDPVFSVSENKALNVARGTAKSPFAKINGFWKPTSAEDAQTMAQEYLNHPEWRQVGMDPERHSFFYDRETRQPIVSAEEALQVGPLVLAKNPQYGKVTDYKYADGGGIDDPTVQQALNVTREYQDPPTKHIDDWAWKSLSDVQNRLGNFREIPSHVQAFGSYMDEIAKRAANEGLSARDLIKAYTITRASIQRRANDVDRVRAAGLDLPKSFTGKIRPEGAFGEWLHTRAGQDYLNSAERGEVNEDAIANAVKIMTPFGRHEKDIPDALRWAASNLPGKEREISTLVANAMRGASEPAEWRAMAKDVRGVGPSKAGFLASLMGRGDQPTLDARQIIEHTGRPTSEAQAYLRRKGGEGATEAVERLSARQQAMDLQLPEELKPYYQHLAHHAVWDKAADEVTTHEDVMNAMRGAAHGGEIDEASILSHPVVHALRLAGLPKLGDLRRADGGGVNDDPTVQQALNITRDAQPTAPQVAATVQPQAQPVQIKPTKYKSWDDVPTLVPQDLVGKRVFSIFADLTKAGSAFTGIDASQLDDPEHLFGGPGYSLLPESQKKGLAWAVEGKGRGSAKIRKDADYVAVSAMMPYSHQSNASFSNALMKNMYAYVRDKRLTPEALNQIDDMIRRPTEQKELQGLQDFPGFAHPNAKSFLRGASFEQRKRISDVLASKEAQALGAPNIDKVTRETLDPEFAGIPRSHAIFLLEIPKGTEDEQLVNLKQAGLPEHPSYQYGIKGRIVGKFHHPVAPEILFKDWFDKANEEAKGKERSNIRRAFDLAMPVQTITQEIADMLPRHPRDIQSGKAARLALNAFNDQWMHTDDPVNKGGVGAADFSQALKNSDFSSTLTQYSPDDINKMKKDESFTGYKLKDGEVYFGLKRNTNYADDYGFEHPDLTPNETALVSVVNNEPGAKGIGGAPVVLKAIQEGTTALDCYAVPSQKHPEGFLPNFYSHFGFKELGRIPFDPQYVTQTQFDDMKHQWRKSGWDESMGLPSLVIMKWSGKDEDRSEAVRNFVRQSRQSTGAANSIANVGRSAGAPEQGPGPDVGARRVSGQDNGRPDRGAVRTDRNARPADRFTRTLSEISALSPEEARHFGLDPAEVEALRGQFPQKAFGGSTVEKALRLTAPARPMVALADLFQRQLRGRPPS